MRMVGYTSHVYFRLKRLYEKIVRQLEGLVII